MKLLRKLQVELSPHSQDARYHQDYCVFSRESAESHNPSFATIAPWVGEEIQDNWTSHV